MLICQFSGSIQDGWCEELQSELWVEQAPSHGTDLIEELQRSTRASGVDRAGMNQEAKMAIDLFRGAVGDTPVMEPIPADSAVSFCNIGGNR